MRRSGKRPSRPSRGELLPAFTDRCIGLSGLKATTGDGLAMAPLVTSENSKYIMRLSPTPISSMPSGRADLMQGSDASHEGGDSQACSHGRVSPRDSRLFRYWRRFFSTLSGKPTCSFSFSSYLSLLLLRLSPEAAHPRRGAADMQDMVFPAE